MSVEQPIVKIEPRRVLCPAHGEHLRANWPKGWAMTGLTLFRKAVASPELLQACGWREGGASVPVERINDLTDTKPLCYFVDEDEIRKVLATHVVDRVMRCDVCGIPGHAGPYTVRDEDGSVNTLDVCVECALLAGRKLHKSQPEGGPFE
jgi:hypothetical protein